MEAAADLQLGFASNETSTNDEMTWIIPYDTYDKFINDVVSASYKDEESFYTAWIDHYYNLNFINVNNQFSEEPEVDAGLDVQALLRDYESNQEVGSGEMSVILTNLTDMQGHSMFIQKYTLLNKAGRVDIDNGYRRFAQYYDYTFDTEEFEEKYQSFQVESLNTEGAEDSKNALKGRKDEGIFETHNKYKWLGTQYSNIGETGNVHDNYSFARIQNWQNNEELSKMDLHVVLHQTNFNLYRGQRVPILIVIEGNETRSKTAIPEAERDNQTLAWVPDKFLSGYYYIKGIKYKWMSSTSDFSQELFLSRREWPILE
jgi:hypothetical protein